MHNNHFFLSILSEALNRKLKESVLVECFSQNKNELICAFRLKDRVDPFYLKIDLNPGFNIISFPHEFHRSKKNSISLFQEVVSNKVEAVKVIQNDRSFYISFFPDYDLLIKLHGNQSNIVLFKNRYVLELFKKKNKKDFDLNFDNLSKELDFSKEAFIQQEGNIQKLYPTFGPFVKDYITEVLREPQSSDQPWKVVERTISELRSGKIYLIKNENTIRLSLIRTGEIIESGDDPIKMLNEFSAQWTGHFFLEKKRTEALSMLAKEEKRATTFIAKTKSAIANFHSKENYQLFADLIMANLAKIKPFDESVSLQDFYSESTIKIPLKKGLSPQKNAENFYRKSKNQNIQVKKSEEAIETKSKILDTIYKTIDEVKKAESVKKIDSIIAPFLKVKERKGEEKPYRIFEFMDYEIRVGKNSKSNDLTTFKFSHKEDLWLHVKDAAGSHVIIKKKAPSVIPAPVLERAAQIAAYYSKRKTEALCPVAYTKKKYVRKRKGDPLGMVVVEKESVILVEPKL